MDSVPGNWTTGPVPAVSTAWSFSDWIATAKVRLGINRHNYTVAPGLYAAGNPSQTSEVLVTANFKLTFDHLRKTLKSTSAWILVLDTRGVNVWCAAGKGTFSTSELVKQIKLANLDKRVSHKRVIVPQLGATGVSARQVKAESGFRVVFGPVRMKDIPQFLAQGRTASQKMRTVTFPLAERLILIPVELREGLKPALIAIAVVVILSGAGPGIFQLSNAWPRAGYALSSLLAGILAGVVITPALLPFIPFRAFAAKGLLAGLFACSVILHMLSKTGMTLSAMAALGLLCMTVSSFLAMNFTGATPFTSPSGVETEMKRFIPVQFSAAIMAGGLWIYSAF